MRTDAGRIHDINEAWDLALKEHAARSKTLDWREKQSVKYAAPLWQRDEQIAHAIRTVPGRIQPVSRRPEDASTIAVVGFGPSLRDTWETIRQFPYTITCSGSHRFLIDRGIIPTWHVEVDPRPHKVKLLGEPHPNVEYLVASTCHPDYFTHLAGFNVKLWHVFDSTEEGLRMLPRGEWAVTGGCDVGLRAMTLAAFLGFRDLHVFGLDGCARDNQRHADAHPYGKQPYSEVKYPDDAGKSYWTTPAMLEASRQTLHELQQMPTVRAKFYGEGLTQAMIAHYTPDMSEPAKPLHSIIGFANPELISADYIAQNAQLHRENLAYGVGGGRHAETVKRLVATVKPKLESVLDYGCGKGYLAKSLPFPIWEYDPAFPDKAEAPRPADLVVCTDVLEHIEPERLQYVLHDLARVTQRVGYFVIHMGPASKTLPDGRNTHLIQRNKNWWAKKLKRFFTLGQIVESGTQLVVVVGPKALQQAQVA